jgi:hypothetical protein
MKNLVLMLFIVLIIASCSDDNQAKDQTYSYTKDDSAVQNYIVLFHRYIDAISGGIYQKEKYSANIRITWSEDTIQMYFYPNVEGEICMPLADSCKYCYLIDGHFIFATESLFSFPSLNIDSVYKTINLPDYERYIRKEPPQPPIIWDIEPMKVRFVRNQFFDIKIGY